MKHAKRTPPKSKNLAPGSKESETLSNKIAWEIGKSKASCEDIFAAVLECAVATGVGYGLTLKEFKAGVDQIWGGIAKELEELLRQ